MWLFDKRDSPSLSEKVGTFIPLTHSPPIGFLLPAELFSHLQLVVFQMEINNSFDRFPVHIELNILVWRVNKVRF